MTRKMAERDEKSGKFLPEKSDDEIIASINSLDEIIDVRKKIKTLDIMLMKYLRGTLKDGKGKSIKLDKDQANILMRYQDSLMNKLTPNARSGETGPATVDVVIKGPTKEI